MLSPTCALSLLVDCTSLSRVEEGANPLIPHEDATAGKSFFNNFRLYADLSRNLVFKIMWISAYQDQPSSHRTICRKFGRALYKTNYPTSTNITTSQLICGSNQLLTSSNISGILSLNELKETIHTTISMKTFPHEFTKLHQII